MKPSSRNGEATVDKKKVDEMNSGATEKVVTSILSDELWSDKEYNAVIESTDNDIYEFEYWDPRNKWETQDVLNHMGEALVSNVSMF